MWQRASHSNSSPGCVWTLTQIWLDMVPDGTNRAASFPSKAATRSWRRRTVGSSPKTSSPNSAARIASYMPGVGRVTVSLRRSMTLAAIVLLFLFRLVFQEPALAGLAQVETAVVHVLELHR